MGTEGLKPRRVHICGCSGSGKSTLGKTLAEILDVPFTELDSIFHLPDWGELPREQFVAKIAKLSESDGWVVDGNYSYARAHLWSRADTVIFLDYPYALVWWRVVRRTLRRMIYREVLWNGNREVPLRTFFTRESIVWWMMTTWHKRHRDAIASETCPELAGKAVFRSQNPAQTAEWLVSLRVKAL
jgi:adenylate kinase family enzyme